MTHIVIAALLSGVTVLLLLLFHQHQIRERARAQQEKTLKEHAEEVENIYQQMRGWRHDYKNHLQTMKAYIELDQVENLTAYLSELDEDLVAIDVNFRTGNTMADAILNSKFSLAKARDIRLTAKAEVPAQLVMSNVELGTILGNLLSNAIEACEGIPEESLRFIRVYIAPVQQQLYVSITNSMEGRARQEGSIFLTTKQASGHGFGLKRIDATVKKYGGYVNRQQEEGVFATEIFLPL